MLNLNFLSYLVVSSIWFSSIAHSKIVRYDLVATQEKVNLSGQKTVDFALAVNGTIPAPTLTFNEGDEAEINVKNQIPNQELSIHWHGLLLPSAMDGVPYVTTPPIKSGESYTFKFNLRQAGTYWYHSHTHLQEQKGVYGAFVVLPKKPTIRADKDVVVILSDWSDEDADQILKNLRKDGDYYLYKKNTVRSIAGAIKAGALGTLLNNEWTRMGGMDLSDVGYDAFLINGKRGLQLLEAKAEQKIRLRIINAAASSYFYVSLGNLPMKVISADGTDIEPTMANEILIGMAETYDVLFELPAQKNYEFKLTAQDGTGFASAWIGSGEQVFAPNRPPPDLYAGMEMDHSKMDHSTMDHSKMDHSKHVMQKMTTPANSVIQTLTVDDLRALGKTDLPKQNPVHEVKLVLNGDMERYVWHINGKALNQDRTIIIKENDVVRFTFENQTMMHHPMHLHGHFFRVLNKHSAFSPLKHTVDVGPHSTRTIEFLANEPGEWMLHCHNLYHMKTGMGRVIKYSSFTPTAEMAAWQKLDPHLHDHIYFAGMAELATNHGQGDLRLTQTWNELEFHFETRKDLTWEGEGEVFYRRWYSNFLNLIVGASKFDETTRGVIGVGYTLPMLVETDLLVDQEGDLRLDLAKSFQWTKSIMSDMDFTFRQNHKMEFEISLMYKPSWSWAAGVKLTEDTAGVGAQYWF